MSSRSDAGAGSPKRLRFGAYEVLFDLATGGMATVMLARHVGDAGFERLVALKRLHAHLLSDPETFAMASDEARLAALIRHPNVVPVTSVLDTGGELVLVQDFVEGASLSTLLRRLTKLEQPLEPPVAVKIAVDALRGLHAAHEVHDLRGEPLEIVHRDVSPQNLLVGADGTTRVIDFGIARAARRMAVTRTGVVKGKLQYMAPEQVEEKAIDRRTDVFALGAVLYEMLCGKRPFGDGEDAAIMGRLLLGEVDLAPIEARAPALAPLVASSLARDPELRPRTALELAKALARALPPADEDDVRATVERAIGEQLAEQRERIRGAVGGDLELEDEPGGEPVDAEGSTLEPITRADREPAGPGGAARRGSRRWLIAAAGLGLAGVGALGWLASRPADRPGERGTAIDAPSASAEPELSPRSTEPASRGAEPAAASAVGSAPLTPAETAQPAPRPTVKVRVAGGAAAPAASAATATATATAGTAAPAGELLPSPYRR